MIKVHPGRCATARAARRFDELRFTDEASDVMDRSVAGGADHLGANAARHTSRGLR